MTPEEIRGAVEYLDACIRDIHTAAEGRALEADEQARFDEGLAERARLVALLERHNTVATLATVPEARESGTTVTAPNVIVRDNPFDLSELRFDATPREITDKSLRAIDAVEGLEDRHREQAESLVRKLGAPVASRIVLSGSPAYRSGFMKVTGGRPELVTPEERDALAAMERAQSLTDNAGGYAVPFTLDSTIIDTGTHSTNPFRQISRIVQITTDAWNGVSSAGASASWDSEGAEVSDDAITLAQPSIPVFKGAVFVPFSVEVGGDWSGIESDLRMIIATAKDDLEGAAFVSGNGTSAPQGITTALDGVSGSEIAPGTAETFAVGDVYKTESALKAAARRNASWIGNKVWYNAIRQFDTGGGAGMWERIGAGQPAELLGYPAYESSDMDAVLPNAAATADNFGLVLGDFSKYVIVDRVGLNVELVPHLFHTSNNRPSGQRGFYAWFRTGAEVVDTSSFAMLSIPTAA